MYPIVTIAVVVPVRFPCGSWGRVLPDVFGELTSQGRASAGNRGVVTSADVELVVVLLCCGIVVVCGSDVDMYVVRIGVEMVVVVCLLEE